MTLFLVAHGRTLGAELDPAGFDDIWALRDRLPQGAVWLTAPEPAAVASCQLLTEGEVGVAAGLRASYDGEPPDALRERLVGTIAAATAQHRGHDLVLVGRGETWAALLGEPALRLGTPDVLALPDGLGSAG